MSLDFVDFVRVYSGLNQTVGILGETSTEVSGAENLHLEESIAAIIATGIDDINGSHVNRGGTIYRQWSTNNNTATRNEHRENEQRRGKKSINTLKRK